MGLICGNCKYERPSNHRGADTSCPLCNTAYHSESAKLGKEAAPLPTITSSMMAPPAESQSGIKGSKNGKMVLFGVIAIAIVVIGRSNMETIGWIIFLGVLLYPVYLGLKSGLNKEDELTASLKSPLPDFNPTQKVMGSLQQSGLAIDEERNKICLITINQGKATRRVISHKDILSVEIVENGTSVTKTSRASQIGGVIVGGVLLGGVGAIIGGLSGKSESSAKVDRIDLRIVVNDTKSPLHDVSFLVDELYSKLEKQRDIARRWHGIISALIKRAETEEQSLRVAEERKAPQKQPSTSVADELKKLAELHDSGVLTLEEFQQQKARVLG